MDETAYYFDSLAARPPRKKALEAFIAFTQEHWMLPTALYEPATRGFYEVQQAYKQLAEFLGCVEQDSLLFCNTVEEAITHGLLGVWAGYSRENGKNHFLASELDDAAILLNLERLTDWGADHELIPSTPEGTLDLNALEALISPRTQMVILAACNPLLGVKQPLNDVAKLCKQRGILLGIDASSLVDLYPLHSLEADFIVFSGRTLGSVAGSALLWVRASLSLPPLFPCGLESLYPLNAHPAALIALATAARESLQERTEMHWHLGQMRQRFEEGLRGINPSITPLFTQSDRLVNTVTALFPGLHSELFAWHLNRMGVYASFGGGHRQQLHYLLKACGVQAPLSHMALSFNFLPQVTPAQIDESLVIIKRCWDKHRMQTLPRRLSP